MENMGPHQLGSGEGLWRTTLCWEFIARWKGRSSGETGSKRWGKGKPALFITPYFHEHYHTLTTPDPLRRESYDPFMRAEPTRTKLLSITPHFLKLPQPQHHHTRTQASSHESLGAKPYLIHSLPKQKWVKSDYSFLGGFALISVSKAM